MGGTSQPPSGGCVLKLFQKSINKIAIFPAAFRRLCVETTKSRSTGRRRVASRLQAAVC